NESEIPSTEVVVIVLEEAANEVGERVLTADADCPAAAGVGHRTNDGPVDKVEFVALPSAAALYITEEAVPAVTKAAGHRGQRIYLGMIHGAGEHQAGVTAAGVGPGVVAGNANDEAARELIIAAGLDAAEETIRVVAPLRLSEQGPERRIANGPFFACPQAADMAAEVAAGPTEVDWRRWRRWRRSVCRARPYIRRARCRQAKSPRPTRAPAAARATTG